MSTSSENILCPWNKNRMLQKGEESGRNKQFLEFEKQLTIFEVETLEVKIKEIS